jgi:hypothetical protein
VDTRQQFFAFRLSQFTEHQPGCSVAAQTENPLQSKALMPFFWLVMFHMARKPGPHRQVSVLEDGPCQYGNPPNQARDHAPSSSPSTSTLGATKAVGPTQANEILQARVFLTRPTFQFDQCSRVILAMGHGLTTRFCIRLSQVHTHMIN